jgi:hypothetical protein
MSTKTYKVQIVISFHTYTYILSDNASLIIFGGKYGAFKKGYTYTKAKDQGCSAIAPRS